MPAVDPVTAWLLGLAYRTAGSRPAPKPTVHRPPGEGSPTREVDRYGTVRYYGRLQHAGVRYATPRVRVGDGVTEAQAKRRVEADLRVLAAQVRAGTVGPAERTTLAVWLERWERATDDRDDLEPSSKARYRALLAMHVTPYLGHFLLSQVRPAAVQAWRERLRDEGRSAATVRAAEGVLRAALKAAGAAEHAVSEALFKTRRTPKPKGAPPPPHLTEGQFVRLLEVAPEPWRTVYAVAYFAMARDGELRGLDWRHVLWTSGQVEISRRVGGRRTEKAPRHHRTGVVDVPAEVVELLSAHRVREEARLGRAVKPTDPVFAGPHGRWSHEGARGALKRHLRAAGLPEDLSWHSFRRGGATAHSAEEVDPFTLQQLMRHADLATTQSYLRPVVRGGKAAAERLAKRVRGAE